MATDLEFRLSVSPRKVSETETVYRVAMKFPGLGLQTVCWDANAVLGIELAALRMAALLQRRGYVATSGEILEAMLLAWENGEHDEASATLTIN